MEQVLMQGGVAGVVVVAWFFFNKGNMKAFEDILKSQSAREAMNAELVCKMVDSQSERADRQHEILKELIETNQHLIGQISELRHMVATNQQCPVQRQMYNVEN
ncbi:MAG: hypothetical protein LBV04_09390 [Deferribacteraceae bacterium]|jgi:uncharacterized membrane protein YccC|nr:hypothetical protein [Deferribacteraceae bacterium]